MTIKNGFNDKETHIRIFSEDNGTINLWIGETGREGGRETLSYLTVEELYQLYKEVKQVGRDLFS